jgi:tetratricopeptide (TPR) repeat protein
MLLQAGQGDLPGRPLKFYSERCSAHLLARFCAIRVLYWKASLVRAIFYLTAVNRYNPSRIHWPNKLSLCLCVLAYGPCKHSQQQLKGIKNLPIASQSSRPVTLFYSYSSKDEELRDQLATHLAMLKRKRVIQDWHDRRISAGDEWQDKISEELESADIILLLVSPDFLASSYCYGVEVERAMKKHAVGEAHVIPVILRPSDWKHTPFGNLQALPKDAKPVSRWSDRDAAFIDVAEGIRQVSKEIHADKRQATSSSYPTDATWNSPLPRPPIVGFVTRRDGQGRDIVERLKEELAPERSQLVTLSGPGGIGKSTLAAQVARELQDTYRRRVVWSSADGRADFMLLSLLDDIATQLGRAELRTLAPAEREEQVRELAAGALVVLDSYEVVAEAEQKRIESWFARTGCSVLFTSRTRVEGTVFVPVSAMSREEAAEFLEKLTVQTLDPQIFTSEVRERVYETAEANPFVMQWVVGQIDLAQEPEAVLEELRHGAGDAARHVFDRSFELPLLGNDGRDALLALSLFAPSATVDALSAVAGFDDVGRVREAVRSLRRLWLVKGVEGNRRIAVEGLTRTLAAARLSKEPRGDEFRRRFIAYFLRYTMEREEPTPENYNALEEEKDNLLGAAEAAFASEDWQSVMRIAYALAADGMLVVRGYWDDAVKLSEKALQAARLAKNPGLLAGLSHNLAVLYQNRGELNNARQLYGESLEAAKMLGNEHSIASTLHNLAAVAQDSGDFDEAQKLYIDSLSIKKEVNDQSGIAATMHQLGLLAQMQGELDKAQRLYNESLEISKRLGDQRGVATTLLNLGIIAQREGMLEEARQLYNESLDLDKKLGNQYGIAVTLHNLGMLAQKEGTLDEARRLYEQSLEIKKRLGDQSGMAATLRNLAAIAQQSGDAEEARRLLSVILAIEESALRSVPVDARLLSTDIVETGQLELDHQHAIDLMHAGSWRKARDILQTNRERYKAINDQRGFAVTLLALAQTEHAIGDLENARWTYKDALNLLSNFDERLAAITSGYLARLELQTGLVKDALTHLREAEDYFERAGNAENLEIIRQLIEAAEEIAAQQTDYETKTSVFMNKRRPRK